jgi:hypothetical protein
MIEGDVLPVRRLVAGRAFLSQRAAVRVIGFVAGNTVLWRALKSVVEVALFARNARMGIGQFER